MGTHRATAQASKEPRFLADDTEEGQTLVSGGAWVLPVGSDPRVESRFWEVARFAFALLTSMWDSFYFRGKTVKADTF